MWVIIPVKELKNSKLRLADVLSPEQRAQFSFLMLGDVLATLSTSNDVEGVTVISSDASVKTMAEQYNVAFMLTDLDSGYSEDAMEGVKALAKERIGTIAIIPSDVPQLAHEDLSRLNQFHHKGLTLCPAVMDGGTNGLLFSPPLSIPLMYGLDSLGRYQDEARRNSIPVKIENIASLERDIDRPGDLLWLRNHASGGKAWSFIQGVDMTDV